MGPIFHLLSDTRSKLEAIASIEPAIARSLGLNAKTRTTRPLYSHKSYVDKQYRGGGGGGGVVCCTHLNVCIQHLI